VSSDARDVVNFAAQLCNYVEMMDIFSKFESQNKPNKHTNFLALMIFIHPVAIKPYLKKYMARYVAIDPHFVLSEKNRFGTFLINSLKQKKEIIQSDLHCKIEGESLNVVIPPYLETHYGIFIPKKNQFRFNSFLLDEFNDRMMDFVLPRINGNKGDIRKALLEFRSIYGIYEDDLPYKTLEKQWERKYARSTASLSA